MSYQYPYIEHYSPSPATSTPQAFAQWEVQDDPLAVSPVQQQTPAPESESASTPTYEVPQVIQLTERPQRRARIQPQVQNQNQSQNQAQAQAQESPNTPARNLNPQQLTPQSLSPATGEWFDVRKASAKASMNGDKRAAATDLAAPVRQALANRAQARLAGHPYHRHANSGDAKTRRELDPMLQVGVGSGAHCTVMACGGPTGDVARFGTTYNSSPSPTGSPTTLSAPPDTRRLLIRTDVHLSTETKMLTAMLELPGVKKSNLRLSLGVCPYSRVKQLIVRGKSSPVFSDEGYTVRERKYGEFKRILVVPPETKSENIQVTLEDGILFLKYPAGSSPDKEESTDIPLN